MNQFRDTYIANDVIHKIENHLDYINSSLATFAIFNNRFPLIYTIEYMYREFNRKFRKADSIINPHDIVISFN